jgi:hypothetical protein
MSKILIPIHKTCQLRQVVRQNPKKQYIFLMCSTSDNFTQNDPYDTNLTRLMSYLSYKTPHTGFNYTSVGESQYQVHGLALCHGDVSDIDCATCVNEASWRYETTALIIKLELYGTIIVL